MSMYFLNEIFPETQTWVIVADKDSVLPEGKYALLEQHCGNPDCHCQACVICVDTMDEDGPQAKPIAIIYYEWDKKITNKNPSFMPGAKQSALAPTALRVFREMLQINSSHIDKLKINHEMVKKYFQEKVDSKAIKFVDRDADKKTNRNDPCHCGSGKKYKKCCINS